MARVRLLDRIHAQCPNGVDREGVDGLHRGKRVEQKPMPIEMKLASQN